MWSAHAQSAECGARAGCGQTQVKPVLCSKRSGVGCVVWTHSSVRAEAEHSPAELGSDLSGQSLATPPHLPDQLNSPEHSLYASHPLIATRAVLAPSDPPHRFAASATRHPLCSSAAERMEASIVSAEQQPTSALDHAAAALVNTALQQLREERRQDEAAVVPFTDASSGRPATSTGLRPVSAAVAASLASTLPVDPLFPSSPSVQLLVALSAAEDCDSSFTASPPPPARLRSTASSSSSPLSTSASHCTSVPSLLGGVGSSPGQKSFIGFGMAAVPPALRSVELRVQQRLLWMSAATADSALHPALPLPHRPRLAHAELLTFTHPLPSVHCCSWRREDSRAARAERVERRRVELQAELEQLTRATWSSPTTQQPVHKGGPKQPSLTSTGQAATTISATRQLASVR